MKYYNFVFYKFYKFMLKIGRNDVPEYKAIIFFSIWLNFYLYTLIFLSEDLGLTTNIHIPKATAVFLYFFIIVINYFIFIKDKKYIVLQERFSGEEKFSVSTGTTIMVFFLFLPFIQLIFILLNRFM